MVHLNVIWAFAWTLFTFGYAIVCLELEPEYALMYLSIALGLAILGIFSLCLTTREGRTVALTFTTVVTQAGMITIATAELVLLCRSDPVAQANNLVFGFGIIAMMMVATLADSY